jgi:V/A-type H+-transporting ATPase subunit E
MSPGQNDIRALESAIMEEARQEASQILADAQAQADSIHQQAQAQANAEREAILQQAREKTKAIHEHTAAAAQLEAQKLKLERREQLLQQVLASAQQQLTSVPQRPDYEQIVKRLVREAAEHLGTDEALVRADVETRKVLNDEALANLGRELNMHLHEV